MVGGGLIEEVQTGLKCTKQPAADAEKNVKYRLNQPVVNLFSAMTASETTEVLIQGGMEEGILEDLILKIDGCMMRYVITAETTVRFRFNPEMGNQFTAATVLNKGEMKTEIPGNQGEETSAGKILKKK